MQVCALSVEDGEVVRAAIIDIDPVFGVHRHVRDLLELHAVGQRAPVLCDFVGVVATSECHNYDLPTIICSQFIRAAGQ